jgi:translation elongation factor P/translation initiation factor 5A
MINSQDIKNGVCIRMDGRLYFVIEFLHVKPGKGNTIMRVKFKDVVDGRVLERRFNIGEKLEDVRVERRPYQFLYKEGEDYIFMNNETFEQVPIAHDLITGVDFLKEGMNVRIMGKVVSIKRETARASFRDCMRILKDAREEQREEKVITREKVVDAIRKVAGEIAVGRMWYAAYRVFVDKKVVRENDYEGFLSLVEEAVPEHPNIPKAVELSRMCIDSFRKPLALWESENAPVQGKRFKDYLRIGRLTQEALME